MSTLETLSRSLYDATGDVRDMNQMLIPRQVLRDYGASHQRLKEALNAFIEYDDFTEAADFSEADSIELERLYVLAIDAARAALEQAKDL